MRFEPKIIRPSEPPDLAAADGLTDEAFEAKLPGELEFLAAQLRDDAAHLASVYSASVYPAGSAVGNALRGVPADVVPPARPSRHRTLLVWSTVGTLASVLLAAAVVTLPWVLPIRKVRSPNLAESKGPAATEDTSVENREADLARLVQTVVEKSDARHLANPASAATPAMFLQNVSGPELEGLFDLWEEDPAEQSRISI